MVSLEKLVDLVEKIQVATPYFEHRFPGNFKPGDDALLELAKELDTTPHILDWSMYQEDENTLYIEGTKTSGTFLPLRADSTLLARKKNRYCIYVLAPTAHDLAIAQKQFAPYEWARPILIPTTFYLESVMYHHILPLRIDEWRHADYVGTISHTAIRKLRDVGEIESVLHKASEEHAHIAAFMYRGDPLLATAEKWHPGFLQVWVPLLRFHGFEASTIISEDIPSFYANYWAAVPDAMIQYIDFFKKVKISLEVLPSISETVWKDSKYGEREGIAGITSERCLEIWGVPWYPMHPFLFERLPCFFFWTNGAKIVGARL